jgi:hypothetical protein
MQVELPAIANSDNLDLGPMLENARLALLKFVAGGFTDPFFAVIASKME